MVETQTKGVLYLNEILDIMGKNSINRKVINWSEFRKAVFQKAPNVKTIAQTDQAIELALKLLNDHHGNALFWGREHCPWFNIPDDIITPSDIGYIRIKGFASTNIGEANDFARSLQTTIKNQYKPGLKGWLLDLRGNGGGNMWPMIAGVGSILGESIAGYFIYEAEVESYRYKGGTSYLNGSANSTVSEPYTLINPDPKVAVLLDAAGSSGEATVIAFIGRPNTRSFGYTGTCGRTTANHTFTLCSGATLGLAVAWMADRNKNKFEINVMPDEISPDDKSAVAAAIAWLSK